MMEQAQGPEAASQDAMEAVAVARVLRVERLETGSRPESDDTSLVAATRSSHVEWTRNAGACVTPFAQKSPGGRRGWSGYAAGSRVTR